MAIFTHPLLYMLRNEQIMARTSGRCLEGLSYVLFMFLYCFFLLAFLVAKMVFKTYSSAIIWVTSQVCVLWLSTFAMVILCKGLFQIVGFQEEKRKIHSRTSTSQVVKGVIKKIGKKNKSYKKHLKRLITQWKVGPFKIF